MPTTFAIVRRVSFFLHHFKDNFISYKTYLIEIEASTIHLATESFNCAPTFQSLINVLTVISLKVLDPIEILHIRKCVQNFVMYKKYSGYFYVQGHH
jgi:hypothetical protein